MELLKNRTMLDYKKLKIEFDRILNSMTKKDLIEWCIFDNCRVKVNSERKYYLTYANLPISRLDLFERGGLYTTKNEHDYFYVSSLNFDDVLDNDLLPLFNQMELSVSQIEKYCDILKQCSIYINN